MITTLLWTLQVKWEDVRNELIEERKLPKKVAGSIGQYVTLKGGKELVERLRGDSELMKVKRAEEGLCDMALLLHYCEMFGILDKVWQKSRVWYTSYAMYKCFSKMITPQIIKQNIHINL